MLVVSGDVWHYCIEFLSLQAVEEFCDGLFKYIEDPVRCVYVLPVSSPATSALGTCLDLSACSS